MRCRSVALVAALALPALTGCKKQTPPNDADPAAASEGRLRVSPGRGYFFFAGPASGAGSWSAMMNCTRRFFARLPAVTFGTSGFVCP